MNDEKEQTVGQSDNSGLLCAAIDGNSDVVIANEVVRRLDAELKESGRTSFTVADLRRIRCGMFGA